LVGEDLGALPAGSQATDQPQLGRIDEPSLDGIGSLPSWVDGVLLDQRVLPASS
jgi:hypothetical protein